MEYKGTLNIKAPSTSTVKGVLTQDDLQDVSNFVANLIQDQLPICEEDCCKDVTFDVEDFSKLLITLLLDSYSIPNSERIEFKNKIKSLTERIKESESMTEYQPAGKTSGSYGKYSYTVSGYYKNEKKP